MRRLCLAFEVADATLLPSPASTLLCVSACLTCSPRVQQRSFWSLVVLSMHGRIAHCSLAAAAARPRRTQSSERVEQQLTTLEVRSDIAGRLRQVRIGS